MKVVLLAALWMCLRFSSVAQTDDSWDAYVSVNNGKPASTMVNMSIGSSTLEKQFPFLLITGVHFTNCSKDGFPAKEEFPKLYKLDDAILGLLNLTKANKHVGTYTHQCERLNYIYVKDTNNLRVLFEDFYKTKYPAYTPIIRMQAEPEWKTYTGFLYPSDSTKEYMSNTKVIEKLTAAGDVLTKPRKVDHYLYFKTAANRTAFIEFARGAGYNIENTSLVKESAQRYQLQISRVDKVDLTSMNKTTVELSREAKTRSGMYDGWETSVVK